MSQTEDQRPEPEDDLEISPETLADLDAEGDDADQGQVGGGGTTGAGCP